MHRISLTGFRAAAAEAEPGESDGIPLPLRPTSSFPVDISVPYAATMPAEGGRAFGSTPSPDGGPGSAGASYRPGFFDGVIVGGHYRIERQIGEGGMGRVFQVRHLHLGKTFALKVMRAGQSRARGAREHFWREARMASSLSHPNIVAVVDFGEDSQVGAYLVMELIEGEPLSALVARKGPFPLRAACDLGMQIAEALRHIHRRQIVHGDIKLDNVLCCCAAAHERRRFTIKLFDFGLARMRSARNGPPHLLDGTPAYLAPERIGGAPPTVAGDVYALGVVFYELLTGKVPFDGSVASVMDAHLHAPPPRLAEQLGAPVDERAEAMILRALAKSPADRHPSVEDFIYELRALMDGLGMARRRRATGPEAAAAPPSAGERHAGRGFEVAPLPMACVDMDGTILAANGAFAHFLTDDARAPVVNRNLDDTLLVEVCPEILSDLRRAIVEGATVSCPLELHRLESGPAVRLMFWIAPAGAGSCEAYLYVHRMDPPV